MAGLCASGYDWFFVSGTAKILTLVYGVWNVAERPICAGYGRKLCFRRFALPCVAI